MGDHALRSPSAAVSWGVCAGYVQMKQHFPDTPSEYAAEGTFTHGILEKCLLTGKNAVDFVGHSETVEDWTFEWTMEDADLLQPTIDWVREQPGSMQAERRVYMEAWIKDCWGTSDIVISNPPRITVVDLKWGRGVTVEADDNWQLMLYGLGAWADLPDEQRKLVKDFTFIISQPRGQGGTWKEWSCDLSYLLKFAEEMAAAALKTEDPNAPLTVSVKGCQFCPAAAAAGCPEMHRFCLELLEDFNMPSPDFLTPERRSYVIEHAGLVKKWLESIHALTLDNAIKGLPTPGFKAVQSLGDRSWANEEQAEEFWKAKMPAKEIYTQKLKSPAQMEKVAGTRNWKAAQELIVRPEGKPSLVPESDPREPLVPLLSLLDDLDDGAIEEEFEDLI